MKRWAVWVCVAAIGSYACGNSTAARSTSTSESLVTKGLYWNQAAATDAEMASIRFAVYLDGTRYDLSGAECAATPSPGTYACSARLPPLTVGPHTLQLASYYAGFEQLESPSPVMSVVIVATGP